MKPPLVAALLAVSLLPLAPSVSAAEPLLTDPEGDAQFALTAQELPLPAAPAATDFADGSDLVSLSVMEREDVLAFTVGVASLESDPAGTDAYTYLDWGDKKFRLATGYYSSSTFGDAVSWAYLEVRQGNDWEWVASLDDPAVDASGATLTASLPKVYLLDGEKRTPGRGDTLLVPRVETDTFFLGLGVADGSMRDAMPDEGGKGASITLSMGDFSQGKLVFGAKERVRVSNGGATTFVFQLELRNTGDAPETYALATADLPPGWNATLQSPVTVEAQAKKTVSLLVSVPFAHEHGGFSSFNVTAQAQGDPASQGRMRLGVLHTPIPQPAGHHSELYLHTRDPRMGNGPSEAFALTFPFAYGWMNTQKEDPENAPILTPSYDGDGNARWWIPLNPSLQVGLDFDLDRTGALVGAIEGKRDAEAQIAAELSYYRGDANSGEEILLAEGAPVPIALTQQGATPFKLTLLPTAESDYIPYQANTYMFLVVSVSGADERDRFNTPAKAQMDATAFQLTLPLNEYHDRLSGEAEAAQSIAILTKGLVEKAGRPGTVLTYAFDVRNQGTPDRFVLDLAGSDVARGTLVPAGEVALATGETREVTLAVEIPVGANPGEEIEVLLFVHARDDPSKMAIARTKTRVTDLADEAMADESAQLLAAQARENQTPGFALALVVTAALVAIAWKRRS